MAYRILDRNNQPAVYRGRKNLLGQDFFIPDAKLIDIDEANQEFTACASTNEIDRMNDIVETEGIDLSEFIKAKGPLMFAHNYSSLPVGRATKIWKELSGKVHKLFFRPKFADFTEEGMQLLVVQIFT